MPLAFLTTPTQESLNELLACLNVYQHAKNQFITSFILQTHSDTLQQRVPSHDWPHPFLAMSPTCKIFNHVFICINLYQHAKNQLIPLFHSSDTVNFRVQRPNWPYLFLTMPNQKIFSQFLIFVNLYQHAKNEAISSI